MLSFTLPIWGSVSPREREETCQKQPIGTEIPSVRHHGMLMATPLQNGVNPSTSKLSKTNYNERDFVDLLSSQVSPPTPFSSSLTPRKTHRQEVSFNGGRETGGFLLSSSIHTQLNMAAVGLHVFSVQECCICCKCLRRFFGSGQLWRCRIFLVTSANAAPPDTSTAAAQLFQVIPQPGPCAASALYQQDCHGTETQIDRSVLLP